MTGKQTFVMAVYGVIGWFAAAMLLRWLGPLMFGLGPLHAVILVISAVIAYPTIWIAARISGVAMGHMLQPTVVFTAAATLCDGIAVTYFPQVYGGVGTNLAYAAGAILFGVSWLLILAVWLQRKAG